MDSGLQIKGHYESAKTYLLGSLEKKKRRSMKPTAILCGDWHIREDTPVCRIDDFQAAQWAKVKFIKELQNEYDCPILHSGDLFDHWKPSPRLISLCIDRLPFDMYVIPGNHDLPNHSLSLLEKSGLWTLERAGKIGILKEELGKVYKIEDFLCTANPIKIKTGKRIGITHQLINHPKSDTTAKGLMKKLKGYDLILTGDNHQSFCFSVNSGTFIVEPGSFVRQTASQILVNPGSLTRQTADQIYHEPCIWLWYAKDNSVESINIPIEQNVITREHLEKAEVRDARMEAFVERLDDGYEIGLSFQKNIEEYFAKNRTRASIKEMVFESLEAEG